MRKTAIGAAAIAALAAVNGPAVYGFAARAYHRYEIDQPEYTARYGHWDLVPVPARYRLNAIHAALLRTGKVLLVAGSGNDEDDFRAGRFRSVLWDPAHNTFKRIPTPKDMFCAGHAALADGRLLVAGGTSRYEKLKGDVTRAGGAMLVKNEDPDAPHLIRKGTVFRGTTGKEYRTGADVALPRAVKTVTGTGPNAGVAVRAAEARVYVEAVRKGEQGVSNTADQYRIPALKGADARNVYGLAAKLGLDKKDFQGLRDAYEFDPVAERYQRVAPMADARWYPTLVSLPDGRVLAVSGLDDLGQIIPGRNEVFDPASKRWSPGPNRYFPTYPALFPMLGGNLFYSGSNAGYGPADQGRTPGMWHLADNTFTPVPGLRDADQTETSASVLLPPAQQQTVLVLGGGGVGESHASTARTALVDLRTSRPRFTEGPPLPQGTRYLSAVTLPDDTVFTSGGSRDYRGKEASDILRAQIYDPARRAFRPAAAPSVGRDYHTEALLLPDGRVAVFGSNPLFADRANSEPAPFEQRIEVYTPPYLFHGDRPEAVAGPVRVAAGSAADFTVSGRRDAAGRPAVPRVRTARLMRPSAVTHVTDVEQRSVALAVRQHGDRVTVSVPADPSLVPRGWYMLFLTDGRGTPSHARWVQVV